MRKIDKYINEQKLYDIAILEDMEKEAIIGYKKSKDDFDRIYYLIRKAVLREAIEKLKKDKWKDW
ncbi:MAG: hypothetical protein QXH07_02425 [Thermoplasmata archaeon]